MITHRFYPAQVNASTVGGEQAGLSTTGRGGCSDVLATKRDGAVTACLPRLGRGERQGAKQYRVPEPTVHHRLRHSMHGYFGRTR